jgi:hypothetical protein
VQPAITKWNNMTKTNKSDQVRNFMKEIDHNIIDPKILVLYSGTGSVEKGMQKIFPKATFVSVEIMDKWCVPENHTHITNIFDFADPTLPKEKTVFQYEPKHFDIVWASPPCDQYSKANTNHKKTAPNLRLADARVLATFRILEHLRPTLFFIENPEAGDRGLRTRSMMSRLVHMKHKGHYCRYGLPHYKPTNIWTNAILRAPLKTCTDNHGYKSPCVFSYKKPNVGKKKGRRNHT